MKYKPMLAATIKKEQLNDLDYPIYVQPKIDGIRCLIHQGTAWSRSLKPIPNLHIQKWVNRNADVLEGTDGELVVGNVTDPKVFNSTQSGVMSIEGEPDFAFHIFDVWNCADIYPIRILQFDRIASLCLDNINLDLEKNVRFVETRICQTDEALLSHYVKFSDQGYEGAILRHVRGLYKHGRSTLKQGYLIKLKPWEDNEAKIVGFKEFMHNQNEPTISETGYQVRSTKKEGMIPGNKLGAFLVECPDFPNVQFEVGSGLTMNERETLWSTRNSLIGKYIKFKYLPIGIKDRPRLPIYLGFRDKLDMQPTLL